MKYDIAVIGGSLGGVQAAVSALMHGKKVYMCEQTDWVGGQLTTQAVPPDEHPWIERFGATKRYLDYRRAVRDHYRSLPAFNPVVAAKECFCPGNSWVSRVAHEPKVALKLLNDSLAPYLEDGSLTLEYDTIAVDSRVENDVILSVTVKNTKTQEEKVIEAAYFLDATDCGDLLPVVGAEYRIGAESKSETGEPNAPEVGNSEDMQPITWVAALELDPEGEDWRIEKPRDYDFYANLGVSYADNKQLSWYYFNEAIGDEKGKCHIGLMDNEWDEGLKLGMWTYRRIIDTANYTDGRKQVSLVNWPQNDYVLDNVIDTPDAEKHLEGARQLTLCTVYWLQNEAERPDGGKGYRVKLRPDIMGTEDGLAKAAYIRECRRIVAKGIVREQDIGKNHLDKPAVFADSVGVGSYAMDLHITTRTASHWYAPTYPFEIPLSAMVPVRIQNLIPACKNIGCTHLTGGCYRLHPVEWNIGESAGHLAAFCLDQQLTPAQVLAEKCADFQQVLEANGVQLHWDFDQMEGF